MAKRFGILRPHLISSGMGYYNGYWLTWDEWFVFGAEVLNTAGSLPNYWLSALEYKVGATGHVAFNSLTHTLIGTYQSIHFIIIF